MTRKEFYNSKLWKQKRMEIIRRDLGICQICKKTAKGKKIKSGYAEPIIDHIIELTDDNFTIKFALKSENLQTTCFICHNKKTFSNNKSINNELEIDFSRRDK